ncbi:MAG: Ig-like domain-containing protein [Pseudomonadota bacterium]
MAMLALTTPVRASALVACAGQRPPVTPLGSNHLAGLSKLDAIAPPSAGVRAVQSGAWSDPATWGGLTPAGRVIIPSGVSVVFDLPASPVLSSVRVEGCLELSDSVSTRLKTEFLYVAPGGELLAGTRKSPIPPSVIAEIVFPDLGPLDVAIDPALIGKGLVAASRVRLYGSLKTPRAKVATTPLKGDAVIQLAAAPTGWRPGDRVVLTGTRFIPQDTKSGVVLSSPTQDEIRFVKSINGAAITLDSALSYSHPSPDASVAAYLVNYTRNVRLATINGAKLPKSQRAHSMYMSTETTLQGVEFFEMGRTDKSLRAVDAAELTAPTPTSNVKGRYPLHLHQSGFPADDVAPLVRGVAVWGSPGWGVAQHAGNAFLYQNNTWNTFGAGFVSESGNETGAWVENTAIKAIGVDHIVKDAGDVSAFDLGRTGDGFWMQSRSVRLSRNLAVGMTGGMGFVYFHRNSDLGSTQPLTPAFVSKALCMPGAMRFKPQGIDKPHISQFADNEVFASEVGFHVVKPSPIEPHDIRSVIDNFTAWEVRKGVDITYTSRYTVKNGLLIGARKETDTIGVDFGTNTYDLAVFNSKISGFDYGVNLSKVSTRTFGPNSRYSVVGSTFTGIRKNALVNRDANDQILTGALTSKPATLAFVWGAGPVTPELNALYLYVEGAKYDSSGRTLYPVATDEFLVNWTNFQTLAAERGWMTLSTGERVMVVPEFYSDRLTGEVFQTSFVVKPATYFPWPATKLDGSSADMGRYKPLIGAPTASNEYVSAHANTPVTIDAFANDASLDGQLIPSGYTPARNGNVEQLANGSFVYTPYPDFIGADRFSYWVRNGQGFVARGIVTVRVR